MAEVENHCFITVKVITNFSQGSPVDAKIIGWKVTGEWNIQMNPKYHPRDYLPVTRRGRSSFYNKEV